MTTKDISAISISEKERQYIVLTQNGLPLCAKPYHLLADELELSVDAVLEMTRNLQHRGVIRRVAAVPNHYKIGYKFNCMTTWDICDKRAMEFGEKVGELPFVSHCYLRPRHLPKWNYNLFAMVHGRSEEEVKQYQQQIKELLTDVLQTHQGQANDVLTSTRILKKTGLRLRTRSKS